MGYSQTSSATRLPRPFLVVLAPGDEGAPTVGVCVHVPVRQHSKTSEHLTAMLRPGAMRPMVSATPQRLSFILTHPSGSASGRVKVQRRGIGHDPSLGGRRPPPLNGGGRVLSQNRVGFCPSVHGGRRGSLARGGTVFSQKSVTPSAYTSCLVLHPHNLMATLRRSRRASRRRRVAASTLEYAVTAAVVALAAIGAVAGYRKAVSTSASDMGYRLTHLDEGASATPVAGTLPGLPEGDEQTPSVSALTGTASALEVGRPRPSAYGAWLDTLPRPERRLAEAGRLSHPNGVPYEACFPRTLGRLGASPPTTAASGPDPTAREARGLTSSPRKLAAGSSYRPTFSRTSG